MDKRSIFDFTLLGTMVLRFDVQRPYISGTG